VRYEQKVCSPGLPLSPIYLLEALPRWSWDPVADDFKEMLDKLVTWASAKGHARPNTKSKDSVEKTLGKWVSTRRSEYKASRLDQEKIRLLEALPRWSWDPVADDFKEMLDKLVAWEDAKGHARPSQTSKDPVEKTLGNWVTSRRGDYKADRLGQEKIRLLEAFPRWSW